ncbi:hypothetical protein, partial [Aquimarina algiphila]|uniref:hypothetical protein n=1 Tax=Aquimarina algiphila TaxID=2047982 RepID=UPI00232E332F
WVSLNRIYWVNIIGIGGSVWQEFPLWINPPSFNEILSKRLNYSKLILKDQKADIELSNGAILKDTDLSLFFTIAQKSLLNEDNGKLLGYLSDRNLRKGITLVRNFFTSGHIQADRALNNYINGQADFTFPYHEVFKGSILGTWRYFKDERAEAINIYDSNLGSNSLQLLRLYVLKFLHTKATIGSSEVSTNEITKAISNMGASKDIIENVLHVLEKNSLIHSNNDGITGNQLYNLTLSGGYYISFFAKRIVYVEEVMYDTNIYDLEKWEKLKSITLELENNYYNKVQRLELRLERMEIFMNYLISLEKSVLNTTKLLELSCIEGFKEAILKHFEKIISNAKWWAQQNANS